MKTTILESSTLSPKEYPFMARHKRSSSVVLFNKDSEGMVIVSGINTNAVGTYSQNWNIFSLPEDWEIVDEITVNFKS